MVRETRSLALFMLHTHLLQSTTAWQLPVDLYRTR